MPRLRPVLARAVIYPRLVVVAPSALPEVRLKLHRPHGAFVREATADILLAHAEVVVLALGDLVHPHPEVVRERHVVRRRHRRAAALLRRRGAHAPLDVRGGALAEHEVVGLAVVVRHAAGERNGVRMRVVGGARLDGNRAPAERDVDHHVVRRRVRGPCGHSHRHGIVGDLVAGPAEVGAPVDRAIARLHETVHVSGERLDVRRPYRDAVRQHVERYDAGILIQRVRDFYKSRCGILRERNAVFAYDRRSGARKREQADGK